MRLQAVILCLLVIFGALAFQTSAIEVSEAKAKELFAKFARFHEKSYLYNDAEYVKRFSIFRDNLHRIESLNAQDASAEYGITKFADLTPEEFANTYLMKPHQAQSFRKTIAKFPRAPIPSVKDIPTTFNWADKGAVTPVKNQGACGSCWAFSTTGNIEGQWFLAGKPLPSLSEQNLVDCSHNCVANSTDPDDCNAGCNGGLPELAYQYVMSAKGIDTEVSYPYEGVDGKCRFNPNTVGARIRSWEFAPTDESELAKYLVQRGPVSVALNAFWLQFYFGGISDPSWGCNPQEPDHAVLLTGYGVADTPNGPKQYWIVKNSWGNWGEKGYFRIARGKGVCGINLYGTSALV